MNHKLKVLGIIPARAGSKGIPYKNTRILAGNPLIHYTIQSALKSRLLTAILVSSDCEEVIRISQQYPGIETPFKRPIEISGDHNPSIQVLKHAVTFYQQLGKTFDFVCLLQPTSPFRKDDLIDKTILKLIESEGDSLATVRKVPDQYNPHWTFKLANSFLSVSTGDESIISRRQDLPDTWHRDGKIYITTPKLIMEGKILGEKLVGFENDEEPNVNIDTLEDWELAENLFRNGFIF